MEHASAYRVMMDVPAIDTLVGSLPLLGTNAG